MDVELNTDPDADTGRQCRVISPSGELDLANAADFRSSLHGSGPGWDVPRVIVDLSAVTFMDVSPLRELRAAQTLAHRYGGWLRLVHSQPGIDRLLRATGLSATFPRYATQSDARTNTPTPTRP
ncbi:STAS domain-containing protein [Streptacidiphilus sp. P02-A3a]|uniref:STAS domain-containing protein n=1 Tax=Streptacidiphilus sp. P02-A3a TaxID=2704468 RepID=UPI0015FA0968|nr:STAS domain-containing protein [Streptacidiphilus sp. P02-A3a]QMU72552.1 STAS domain-containing protein [Streptacidiphilus sp. P02-A3a]